MKKKFLGKIIREKRKELPRHQTRSKGFPIPLKR
nr:MAG TPA_asm: hypothetical protein [Caudoviricetes sp.]